MYHNWWVLNLRMRFLLGLAVVLWQFPIFLHESYHQVNIFIEGLLGASWIIWPVILQNVVNYQSGLDIRWSISWTNLTPIGWRFGKGVPILATHVLISAFICLFKQVWAAFAHFGKCQLVRLLRFLALDELELKFAVRDSSIQRFLL